MSTKFISHGTLVGHTASVTCLATAPGDPSLLMSSSRDKSLVSWNVTRDEANFAVPMHTFHGHEKYVDSLALSSDGIFAASASWDKTIRLWDTKTGDCLNKFTGHTSDVMSIKFSPDNNYIVSGDRDGHIKVWNLSGYCMDTLPEGRHMDMVSDLCFTSNPMNPLLVSAGWDKHVKIWDFNTGKLLHDLHGHHTHVNSVAVSPDGTKCVSGSKDGEAIMWDLQTGRRLYTLDTNDTVDDLEFSPNRPWLCTATSTCIMVWDLDIQSNVYKLITSHLGESEHYLEPKCLSLAWSPDGNNLFAGYSDHLIRAWEVKDEEL
ncbi:cross-pathway control WD-repeat protein cpc2 [Dipsacomyces acuminosporus]|nr:cross-pathway control WD-repeat protein cpc2 [Dipsacomyces acuminosporus]